jgi:hypothetical protein
MKIGNGKMLLKKRYKKEDISKIVEFAQEQGLEAASIKFARPQHIIKGWGKGYGVKFPEFVKTDIKDSAYDKYTKLIRSLRDVNNK